MAPRMFLQKVMYIQIFKLLIIFSIDESSVLTPYKTLQPIDFTILYKQQIVVALESKSAA